MASRASLDDVYKLECIRLNIYLLLLVDARCISMFIPPEYTVCLIIFRVCNSCTHTVIELLGWLNL